MSAAASADASAAIFSGDSKTLFFNGEILGHPPPKKKKTKRNATALKAMNWAEGPAQMIRALLSLLAPYFIINILCSFFSFISSRLSFHILISS